MKIQAVKEEHHPKVNALLQRAFPRSVSEADLVMNLRKNQRPLQEWVCLHINKAIAYIAFSNAYRGKDVCGLHLAPMAVSPEFQKQGIGSELMRFALRQASIKDQTVFVLGEPKFYRRFGFEPCVQPTCAFDKGNAHFQALRNGRTAPFVVGYEPEFTPVSAPSKGKKR
jgi:putative acetyltransferase